MKNLSALNIVEELEKLFPDAKGELNARNTYELSIAVILSAQSTDVSVNQVTPALFEAYPNLESLANAKAREVESYIARLGLYRAKAANIIGFAKGVVD